MSALEETFAFQLKAVGIHYLREFRFHPVRKWRFDFVIVSDNEEFLEHIKIAIEVEGGTWLAKGGHTTGKGFECDCEKYNEAAIMGWTVLRFTGGQVKSGHALTTTERAIKSRIPMD